MKISKAIRYITGLIVVGLFFGLPLLSPRLYTQETPTEARTVKIDQQTSKVSLLQNQKNDLQDQLNSMERENQILEFEIIELEKEKSDLEPKISKNQISLSELEKPLPDTAENTLKQSLEKEKVTVRIVLTPM